jgi:hypothetical protein
MTVLKNTFDTAWRSPQAPGAWTASLALLVLSYGSLCLAAGISEQPTYPSPEAAVRELYSALQDNDLPAARRILGADGRLVSIGDTTADRRDRERIVQKYQEMHRLVRQADGSMVLYIGAENWPLPLPLVSKNGAWRFDADVGAKEIVFRQIGENEITAIAVCHALAQRHRSSDMEQEASTPEEAGSLISTLLSGPAGGVRPVAFQGYNFRILSKSRDDFAAIAYPVAYRVSGVMTFVVNASDVVFEKDLGPTGGRTVQTMTRFRPDSSWVPADEQ